ncbi:hypothetical protein DYU05_03865 [Mucilaginibacter terrenus]|uniref:Wax synthase domain-containing protein n=1 Tax=Mucilaginibacter terrenus TaxID=2482727 RepID=A0A3E2NUS4_9SPHI|nr:MBOAT family protein [Mucilaginibacter terrenus]RFZ84752.1 hypothetical protein DYU05_03865 [Mucilaginibacter terrenus]
METITHVSCFAVINLLVILVGYSLIRAKAILLNWTILISTIAVVSYLFIQEGAILRMLAIIATTFTGMKVIAVTEGYRNKNLTLTFKQWCVYAIGWVGMRAEPFETLGAKPLPCARSMINTGISRVVAGAALILLARYVEHRYHSDEFTYLAVTALLLVGFSLVLHFGFLAISAGMWRFSGVNTYLLFRHPARALSLTELWSKRWNIAFSEMTSVAVFRPLRKRMGPAAALLIAFVFSGLLHELALSVPVNAGYGLPTLYFLLQGLLVLVEKLLMSKNIFFLKNNLVGRVWVFFWLVLPMPLLFHPAFIKGILWPMAGL